MSAPQKRLTCIVVMISFFGTVVLSLFWWDSTRQFTRVESGSYGFTAGGSLVLFDSEPGKVITSNIHFNRGSLDDLRISNKTIFPNPGSFYMLGTLEIWIPIYLILLTYLASLLLIWLVLMNRLARRDFQKTD